MKLEKIIKSYLTIDNAEKNIDNALADFEKRCPSDKKAVIKISGVYPGNPEEYHEVNFSYKNKKWNVEMLEKIDDFSATDDVSKFLILSCIADNPEDIQFWATKDGIEQRFNSHDLSYLDNLNALKSEYDYKKLKNLEFRLILKNKLAEYAFGDFKIEREKEFIKKYSYLGKDNWLFSHQVSTYEVASILKGSILKGFIMHKSNKVEIKVEIKYENAQAVQNEP